jgi:hypothetical protein
MTGAANDQQAGMEIQMTVVEMQKLLVSGSSFVMKWEMP